MDILERVQERALEMMKRQEHFSREEVLVQFRLEKA